MDLGLLIVRIVVGLLLMGHGAQKAFGWFKGPGYTQARGFIGGMLRFRPAEFWTIVVIVAELGGGLLFALGLLSPIGALAILATMIVAAVAAHWPRFWVQDGGIEYPLVLAAVAVGLGLTGPGAYALDPLLGISLPAPTTFIVGLIIAVVGAVIALATRAPQPVPTAQPGAGEAPQPRAV